MARKGQLDNKGDAGEEEEEEEAEEVAMQLPGSSTDDVCASDQQKLADALSIITRLQLSGKHRLTSDFKLQLQILECGLQQRRLLQQHAEQQRKEQDRVQEGLQALRLQVQGLQKQLESGLEQFISQAGFCTEAPKAEPSGTPVKKQSLTRVSFAVTPLETEPEPQPLVCNVRSWRSSISSNVTGKSRTSFCSWRAKEVLDEGANGDIATEPCSLLWPIWATDKEPQRLRGQVSTEATIKPEDSRERTSSNLSLYHGQFMKDEDCPFLQYFVIRPSSPRRMAWDLLSLIVLAVDLFTLPLTVFGFDSLPAAVAMRSSSVVFWILDIAMSFFSGYNSQGIVEMRPGYIARRYIKSWFFPDLLIVGLDGMLLLFDTDTSPVASVGRLGKSFRMARLLRAVRIFRVVKFVLLLGHVGDFVFSQALLAALTMARLFLFLIIVIHYVSCGWYAVATFGPDDAGGTWLEGLQTEDGPPSPPHCYFAAFHWSLTQFTPAPSNLHPQNFRERLYAILVLLLGFGFFSAFLANVTGVVNHVLSVTRERTKQRELARKFISDSKISLELGNRIISFIRCYRGNEAHVLECDVASFKMLPERLVMQMRKEAYLPYMEHHAFFNRLSHMNKGVVLECCHRAVTTKALVKDDELFHFGMQAECMVFVMTGEMRYVPGMYDAVSLLEGAGTTISANQWLCEAVLWVHWEHRGYLASQTCTLVALLNSKKFRAIATSHPSVLGNLRKYARLWVERLLGTCANKDLDLTDIDDAMSILHLDIPDLVEQTFRDY